MNFVGLSVRDCTEEELNQTGSVLQNAYKSKPSHMRHELRRTATGSAVRGVGSV